MMDAGADEGEIGPVSGPSATRPEASEKSSVAALNYRKRGSVNEMLFGNSENDDAMGGGGFGGGKDANSMARIISAEQLQSLLKSRGLDSDALGRQLLDELRFPVRQYAHTHSSTSEGVREDFAETLYWQPLLITDSAGTASIRFDLSDSVTSFRVMADAHTSDGRIGSGDGIVVSRIPMQIEPKMPLAVTAGDRIDLPVALINATQKRVPVDLSIKAKGGLRLIGSESTKVRLEAEERSREHFAIDVLGGQAESAAMIEITGNSDKRSLSDVIRRSPRIEPSGYPIHQSISGSLNEQASISLPLPDEIVSGSLAVSVRAFPSPLADLLTGVESILREPHGCFEQTSATNYPNAMALQYMQESGLTNPEVSRRARTLLDKGYGKLTSFECKKRGYEWFGSDPGHEALSAFGLMQFYRYEADHACGRCDDAADTDVVDEPPQRGRRFQSQSATLACLECRSAIRQCLCAMGAD